VQTEVNGEEGPIVSALWFVRLGLIIMALLTICAYRYPELFNWPLRLPVPVYRYIIGCMLAAMLGFLVVSFFVDITR
jgi:hypothetical protein